MILVGGGRLSRRIFQGFEASLCYRVSLVSKINKNRLGDIDALTWGPLKAQSKTVMGWDWALVLRGTLDAKTWRSYGKPPGRDMVGLQVIFEGKVYQSVMSGCST